MLLSFVITTYNRVDLVSRAIDSIIRDKSSDILLEIVVVDDASTDSTLSFLSEKYESEINSGLLCVISNTVNVGVTGSKNKGFESSSGEWVIFLDSDDMLISNGLSKINSEIITHSEFPIIFFRCQDLNNNMIGRPFDSDKTLNLNEYVEHTSYGEALTCINKNIVKNAPYIDKLRGYEGLGCSRIILAYGPAILSTVIARVYDTSNDDRLSSLQGYQKRALLLCKGHFIYFMEFRQYMNFFLKVKYTLKIIIYFQLGVYNILTSYMKKVFR